MNFKDKLLKDKLIATKNNDYIARDILSVVIGELERNDKSDPVKIIQKLIESNNEILSYRENKDLQYENLILNFYLPKKLTGKDLFDFIKDLNITETHIGKATGIVVKAIKDASLIADSKEIREALSL